MRDLLSNAQDGQTSKGPKCPVTTYLGNNQSGLRMRDTASDADPEMLDNISIAVLAKWWKLSGYNKKTGQKWESSAYRYKTDEIKIWENKSGSEKKGQIVFEGPASAGKLAIPGKTLSAQICGIAFYKNIEEADFQINRNSLCIFQFSGDLMLQVNNSKSTTVDIHKGEVVNDFLTWEISQGAEFDEIQQASGVTLYVEFTELEQWHKNLLPTK